MGKLKQIFVGALAVAELGLLYIKNLPDPNYVEFHSRKLPEPKNWLGERNKVLNENPFIRIYKD